MKRAGCILKHSWCEKNRSYNYSKVISLVLSVYFNLVIISTLTIDKYLLHMKYLGLTNLISEDNVGGMFKRHEARSHVDVDIIIDAINS